MKHPKCFISYSWSTREHVEWVLDLASDLVKDGVDVILDKWHLREGNDVHKFMERMVNDAEISKVLIVCDRMYVEKANLRSGGVGAETQIISADVYEKHGQNKFVALVRERDDDGKPLIPSYYRSRLYIDMSADNGFADSFETLLRWIYDKPLNERPELGKPPPFVTGAGDSFKIGNVVLHKRAINALAEGRPNASLIVRDYLSDFRDGLENIRIKKEDGKIFDDTVVDNLIQFQPYRDHLLKVISQTLRNLDEDISSAILQKFFEYCIPYFDRPAHITSWTKTDFDNYKFILHECLLYTIGIALDYGRFEAINTLVSQDYIVSKDDNIRSTDIFSYMVFNQYLWSLDSRNKRLSPRKYSLRAELIEERCKNSQFDFQRIMEADLILYFRSILLDEKKFWWPYTLLYATQMHGPLYTFAKCRSKNFFDRFQVVLGVKSKKEIGDVINSAYEKNRVPTWGFDSPDLESLMDFQHLASKS